MVVPISLRDNRYLCSVVAPRSESASAICPASPLGLAPVAAEATPAEAVAIVLGVLRPPEPDLRTLPAPPPDRREARREARRRNAALVVSEKEAGVVIMPSIPVIPVVHP